MIFQLGVSAEILADTLTVALIGLIVLALARRQLVRERLPYAAKAIVLAVVILLPAAAWFGIVSRSGPEHLAGPNHSVAGLASLSTDLAGPVRSHHEPALHVRSVTIGTSFVRLGRRPARLDPAENGSYIGIPILLLLAVGLYRFRREGLLRFAILMAGISLVLSMGSYLACLGPQPGYSAAVQSSDETAVRAKRGGLPVHPLHVAVHRHRRGCHCRSLPPGPTEATPAPQSGPPGPPEPRTPPARPRPLGPERLFAGTGLALRHRPGLHAGVRWSDRLSTGVPPEAHSSPIRWPRPTTACRWSGRLSTASSTAFRPQRRSWPTAHQGATDAAFESCWLDPTEYAPSIGAGGSVACRAGHLAGPHGRRPGSQVGQPGLCRALSQPGVGSTARHGAGRRCLVGRGPPGYVAVAGDRTGQHRRTDSTSPERRRADRRAAGKPTDPLKFPAGERRG